MDLMHWWTYLWLGGNPPLPAVCGASISFRISFKVLTSDLAFLLDSHLQCGPATHPGQLRVPQPAQKLLVTIVVSTEGCLQRKVQGKYEGACSQVRQRRQDVYHLNTTE